MLFYVCDRKNIVPRKTPTNLSQKDNLTTNANGNRTSSAFNQGLKETVKNGPVENQLSGATTATAVTQKKFRTTKKTCGEEKVKWKNLKG